MNQGDGSKHRAELLTPVREEALQDPEGLQAREDVFDAHAPSGEFCVEGLCGRQLRCALASLDRAQQPRALVMRPGIGLVRQDERAQGFAKVDPLPVAGCLVASCRAQSPTRLGPSAARTRLRLR